ncbi:MAG: hypothetical protein PHE59_04445 [Patescibacteria group bacterium]|nr:hypothetical protein [Patescibacteria group bacterium]MDD5164856.1 hypothetical protein [Patescibacteria group bacterium]MDD5534461.1 hypothetical protein [Patescibacteria group bacterium]
MNLFGIKKKIKNILPENCFRQFKYFYRRYVVRRKSAVFYLSYQCNYKCPYCIISRAGYSDIYPKKCEHSWSEWVDIFKKLPPLIISLSGGEPFLNLGIIDLINNLPSKHIVNITTNLSLPVDEFINRVSRKIQITASLHLYEADVEIFKERVLKLKKANFSVFINFVGYPQKISLIPELKLFFEKHGVHFNVDPYIDPAYKYSSQEIELIKKYAKKFRKMGFKDNTGPQKCYAGSMHFIILPNGDCYACQSGFYYNTSKLYKHFDVSKDFCLGNLFSGTFKFWNKPVICSLPCNEACDIESAFVRRLN